MGSVAMSAPTNAPARSATAVASTTKPAVTSILMTSESQNRRSGDMQTVYRVVPAKAGTHNHSHGAQAGVMGSRLRGNDTGVDHARCSLMSTGGPLRIVW